jgi:DNA-binding response OmpR family regulator
MASFTNASLLAIGVANVQSRSSAFDLYTASTLREAIATIRLISFDLLIVGLDEPQIDVWELMRRVLAAWPQQRWILASQCITERDEVLARSLGALMVLGEWPDDYWLGELLATLRERNLARRMSDSLTKRMPSIAGNTSTVIEAM